MGSVKYVYAPKDGHETQAGIAQGETKDQRAGGTGLQAGDFSRTPLLSGRGPSHLYQGVGLLRMYPFHQLLATVLNRRSLYGFSFATAVVRVSMENSVHVKVVDGFGEA